MLFAIRLPTPSATSIPPKIKSIRVAKGSIPPSFVSKPFPPFTNDITFPINDKRDPPCFSFNESIVFLFTYFLLP